MSGRARLTVCAVVATLGASCALLSLTALGRQADRTGVSEGPAGGGPVAGAFGASGFSRGAGTDGGAGPVAAPRSGAEA